MKFTDALKLPEGPHKTAAIAAWVQSLFTSEDQVPVLDALRAFDQDWLESEPNPETLERWANSGPQEENS